MKSGILFALGAYLSWGLFPLYFRQIATIPALQIVAHRTLWKMFAECVTRCPATWAGQDGR